MTDPHRSQSGLARERRANLSRRRFLRGVGACLALPAFESLLPRGAISAWAADPIAAATGERLAVSASGAPLRMAYMYIPNGVHQANWWPTGEGKDFKLSPTLEP